MYLCAYNSPNNQKYKHVEEPFLPSFANFLRQILLTIHKISLLQKRKEKFKKLNLPLIFH